MTKQIISTIKVLTLAVVLSFGLSYVYAWTAPTAPPPTGNVSAPLNAGITDQIKIGKLTVGGLDAGDKTISTTGFLSGNEIIANKLQLLTGAGAGKVLTSDASGNATWQTSTGVSTFANSQTFDTPGTYTFIVPSGVTKVMVAMVGGGGGGGGGRKPPSSFATGGGGGGGSTIMMQSIIPVSFGVNPTVVVGAGGAGGAAGGAVGGAGGAGGYSSFGNFAVFGGAGGGINGGGGAPGNFAQAGVSTFAPTGGAGGAGSTHNGTAGASASPLVGGTGGVGGAGQVVVYW